MHISYTAHDANSSSSCSNLIEYLDKENQIFNNIHDIKKYEQFFNSEYDSINSDLKIDTRDIINNLDNNKGTQKLSSSNYFMLNISPSQDELRHMEKLAVEELEKRGLFENINDTSKNIYFIEQKNELMKMQLKLYTKDVMTEYAKNFNREIFADESKLPNDKENKILKSETEKLYTEYLKKNNIDLKTKKDISLYEKKEYITLNNVEIIKDNGKSLEIEIDLKEKGKSNVFVPKSTLHMQLDGSYKMPVNLYEEKEKEVIAKNILKEIDYKFIESKDIVLNKKETKVYEFQLKDERFSEPLKISINENDLKIKNKKYFITEHLLNEKKDVVLKKAIDRDYGKEKENIYNKLAKDKGFDLSKRPLEEKDLLWYGKIETTRNYKFTDESIKHNKQIFQQIKEIENSKSFNKNSKIKELESKLLIDKHTNQIIKEGNLKGGNQYHAHVVVSRHDKTMENPRNKISLSPLANAIDSKMENGAQVGFDRKEFANKIEKVFDEKFEFKRDKSKTFEAYNSRAKEYKNEKGNDKVTNRVKNETKQFLMKHTGLNEIKKNISPVQNIKNELGIANIPTQLPSSVTQVAIKVIKKVISQSQGVGY